MFLIIILIVVLIYLSFQRVEGFSSDKKIMDKKALICYYGGSFREGGSSSITNDTKFGYNTQENASITHAKLKQVLNDKGYQTDILISTRNTKYSNKLESWYEPYNMILNKISEQMHGKDYMIHSTVDNINKLNKYDYDFILFVRIDLFLKPNFFKILNVNTDKIEFIANNYDPMTCKKINNANDPEIVDLFVLIPKKYFYILDKKFEINHNSWTYYKKQYKLKDSDMKFMTNESFDSNSYKELNDYYVMSSRKESTHKYNTEQLDFKNKKNSKKCPRYNPHKQTFINEPSQYYLNKYTQFYNL